MSLMFLERTKSQSDGDRSERKEPIRENLFEARNDVSRQKDASADFGASLCRVVEWQCWQVSGELSAKAELIMEDMPPTSSLPRKNRNAELARTCSCI